MKMLVVSDIHQEEQAVERIAARMSEGMDRLLVCGDLSHSVSFAEDFLSSFPDAYIIPGNWDNEAVGKVIAEAKNYIHGRRVELGNGLNLVGYGYSNVTPFHTFGERKEEEIYSEMSKLPIDENTVLALHCSPKGFFDEARGHNVGSESILRIIRERKPFAAFFGHIHEHRGSFDLRHTGHPVQHTRLVKVPAATDLRAVVAETNSKKLHIDFVVL